MFTRSISGWSVFVCGIGGSLVGISEITSRLGILIKYYFFCRFLQFVDKNDLRCVLISANSIVFETNETHGSVIASHLDINIRRQHILRYKSRSIAYLGSCVRTNSLYFCHIKTLPHEKHRMGSVISVSIFFLKQNKIKKNIHLQKKTRKKTRIFYMYSGFFCS